MLDYDVSGRAGADWLTRGGVTKAQRAPRNVDVGGERGGAEVLGLRRAIVSLCFLRRDILLGGDARIHFFTRSLNALNAG